MPNNYFMDNIKYGNTTNKSVNPPVWTPGRSDECLKTNFIRIRLTSGVATNTLSSNTMFMPEKELMMVKAGNEKKKGMRYDQKLRHSEQPSKRVAEGDADYDRKGKRPAQPPAAEVPSRTIHAPEDGWLDKDSKVHRRHTADARILQRDLDDVFQIYDLLAPAEEPVRDLVEDGTDLPASSPASSAELFKKITAALALCTTVALRINKRGKKLHVEHEYGAEVAKEFDAVDPLGGKGSADYKELKKAIEKVKAKKPSSSSSREKPSSSSREPESFHRGSDDWREGGRREEKSPSGRSSATDITCYRCQRKGHFSRDCPSARR
eukprot:jgi/Tetstr1/441227/TSEL_029483.t1